VNHFYLDASAYIKRYHTEDGSDIVNLIVEYLLSASNPKINKLNHLLSCKLGVLEVVAALNRKKNEGSISQDELKANISALKEEIKKFFLYPLSDDIITFSLPLILKHNLNASDALYLFIVLKLKSFLEQSGNDIVLVTADKRLFRAGLNEGLQVVNPEAAASSLVRSLF